MNPEPHRKEPSSEQTPRTDAALRHFGMYVDVDFTRTLERELADALLYKAAFEKVVKANLWLHDEPAVKAKVTIGTSVLEHGPVVIRAERDALVRERDNRDVALLRLRPLLLSHVLFKGDEYETAVETIDAARSSGGKGPL